jgi:hypothetical protein
VARHFCARNRCAPKPVRLKPVRRKIGAPENRPRIHYAKPLLPVCGSSNPKPGTAEFDQAVWSTDVPAWLLGGTSFVLPGIAMDLDGWDKSDRLGFAVIPAFAHVRRSRERASGTKMYRRGYNYGDAVLVSPPTRTCPRRNLRLLGCSGSRRWWWCRHTQ